VAIACLGAGGCSGGGETGAGGEGGAGGSPDVPCAPGEQELDDGRCQPPGLPLDMKCPPGETPLKDGSCQAAGVPPELCGDGFEADGEGGCRPILPEEPCPDGRMAVPGETECHEVMPCGTGTWGDIPIEPGTHFVDKSYPGVDSDGTQEKPWTTIQQGIQAAAAGAIVAVAAGTYAESISILIESKRLRGRCPSMVSIEGVRSQATVATVLGANGSEIRGVGISGPLAGVYVEFADDVLLENVWIHDTGGAGVMAWNPSSVTVRGSLVERTGAFGVHTIGGVLTVERTLARDVGPGPENYGVPVSGIPDGAVRAQVTVTDSLVERIYRWGVVAGKSDMVVEGLAIRSPAPDALPDNGGLAASSANLTVRGATIEGLSTGVVIVDGSEATLERVTVARGPSAFSPALPYTQGILVQSMDAATSHATIRQSAVMQQPDYGIYIHSSSAVIESTLVRDNVRALGHSAGIGAQESDVTIRHTVIANHPHFGLELHFSTTVLEESAVREVTSTPHAGACVMAGWLTNKPAPPSSTLTVRSSLIEDCALAGVFSEGLDLVIDASVVRGVAPQADGLFGDGIVAGGAPDLPGTMRLTGVRVEDVARAGVAAFGAPVDIGFSSVSCAEFDLAGEEQAGLPFSFDKLGDNICGCPDATELCQVESPGLAPPIISH
jgi:hypothetical protein